MSRRDRKWLGGSSNVATRTRPCWVTVRVASSTPAADSNGMVPPPCQFARARTTAGTGPAGTIVNGADTG
jgi:hypothetical protein